MRRQTREEKYDRCAAEGAFIPLEDVDREQIRTMLNLAVNDYKAAQEWVKGAPKGGVQWNSIFKLHYDVLHQLSEAFMLFDRVKIKTHECLFSYLCAKHPELELSWEFLEDARMKRNRSIYYGEPATYDDCKRVELHFKLSIKILQQMIEKKLKEN